MKKPKRKPLTKDQRLQLKMKAYGRHWEIIRGIQEEMNRQWIHEGLKVSEVAGAAGLGFGTTARFLHYGRGAGKMTYSTFHGPIITTFVGIAGALDLEVRVMPRRRKRG